MGTPLVPLWFPTSLPPISSPPPAMRESHSTLDTHIHTPPSPYPNTLPFGNALPFPKPDSTFQIGFCNIGGFPTKTTNNEKVSELKHFFASSDLDLFSGCESNLNWKCLPDQIQLKEWFHSANSCRTFATNNTHEHFGKFQFGSTFWIAAGHVTGHIALSDKDPTQLGCWVSCSMQGQFRKILTIIFAYCPCLNIVACIRSVYAQHHRYFAQLHKYTCPHAIFLEDLESFICSCREALLFGNMNGNIKHPTLNNFMNSVELHELILSCFPHLPPPATFLCRAWSGKIPINGVWALDDVTVAVASSWCSTSSSSGDHQAIIVDVNMVNCISKPHYSIAHPPS